jgi:hypothetical protein
MTASTLLCRDTTLIILPWPDPEADRRGHEARGRYAELFVLPILGPTATWLLRRLVDGLEAFPDGYELDLAETAGALGLNYQPDRVGPFAKSLQRVVMFGYAQQVPYGLAVRSHLPSLTTKQLERLPSHLRHMHAEWVTPRVLEGV